MRHPLLFFLDYQEKTIDTFYFVNVKVLINFVHVRQLDTNCKVLRSFCCSHC